MKTKLILLPTLFIFGMTACKKTDLVEEKQKGSYVIRVAAVDNDGARTSTSFSRVTSGKVAVEFETGSVENVKQYDIQMSSDGGRNFETVKTIAADMFNPNKMYRDTILVGK